MKVENVVTRWWEGNLSSLKYIVIIGPDISSLESPTIAVLYHPLSPLLSYVNLFLFFFHCAAVVLNRSPLHPFFFLPTSFHKIKCPIKLISSIKLYSWKVSAISFIFHSEEWIRLKWTQLRGCFLSCNCKIEKIYLTEFITDSYKKYVYCFQWACSIVSNVIGLNVWSIVYWNSNSLSFPIIREGLSPFVPVKFMCYNIEDMGASDNPAIESRSLPREIIRFSGCCSPWRVYGVVDNVREGEDRGLRNPIFVEWQEI